MVTTLHGIKKVAMKTLFLTIVASAPYIFAENVFHPMLPLRSCQRTLEEPKSIALSARLAGIAAVMGCKRQVFSAARSVSKLIWGNLFIRALGSDPLDRLEKLEKIGLNYCAFESQHLLRFLGYYVTYKAGYSLGDFICTTVNYRLWIIRTITTLQQLVKNLAIMHSIKKDWKRLLEILRNEEYTKVMLAYTVSQRIDELMVTLHKEVASALDTLAVVKKDENIEWIFNALQNDMHTIEQGNMMLSQREIVDLLHNDKQGLVEVMHLYSLFEYIESHEKISNLWNVQRKIDYSLTFFEDKLHEEVTKLNSSLKRCILVARSISWLKAGLKKCRLVS